MRKADRIFPTVLAVLLAGTVYGLVRTRSQAARPLGYQTGSGAAMDQGTQVDQSPLLTAQALVAMPTTTDELPFAQDALRAADTEMDLAFAMALANATQHPPALSPEAKQIQARLQRAQEGLATEQKQVAELTAAEDKAGPAQKDAIENQLALAKATLELRQDQVDDAKQDLIRAGGDPEGRIQQMVQEHQTASQSSDSTKVNVVGEPQPRGLVARVQQWWALHQKQMDLWKAKANADALAAKFSAQHEALESQTNTQEEPSGGAAQSNSAGAASLDVVKSSGTANAGAENAAKAAAPTDAETAEKLAATKIRSADRRTLSALDKRVSDQQELASIYGQWIGVVAAQQRLQVNRCLAGALIILVIALIGLFVDDWIESVVRRMQMDRRQTATLRSATRVLLQIVAFLLVLMVIFGPPTQLGTFLGLAGAGLTIALKDFPVAFVGWFVLMGKGGIRLGDWVEINGVTGEVIELGMFRTVLLETGNWTESGHPTGRRVTFPNTYAVEGHYFNFSTSGQWMWDQLQVVLPGSQNPYPFAEALRKKVTEETAEVVRQAEAEWHTATKSRDMNTLSAAPSIDVKPVVGGTQISVRYITSAHRRSELRAKLNHAAVDLLGLGHPSEPQAAAPKPALTTN